MSLPLQAQLKVLAPILAEFEAKYPTPATLPNGGIVYPAPQITPEGSIFVDHGKGLFARFQASAFRCLFQRRNPISDFFATPVRLCLRVPGFKTPAFQNNDAFWTDVLTRGNPAACPERLKGLYWMQVPWFPLH